MPLGTDHINLTIGTDFIPEIWSGKVLLAVESRLVAEPLITNYSEFAGGDEGFGDNVYVNNISNLVANDKAEDVEVTLQAPNETDNTLLVNKHKETSYLIEDRLRTVALKSYLEHYSRKAGFAIAKSKDTEILAEYANAASFVGDNATPVTRENIVAALFKLDEADAPQEGRAFI